MAFFKCHRQQRNIRDAWSIIGSILVIDISHYSISLMHANFIRINCKESVNNCAHIISISKPMKLWAFLENDWACVFLLRCVSGTPHRRTTHPLKQLDFSGVMHRWGHTRGQNEKRRSRFDHYSTHIQCNNELKLK